MIIFRFQPFIAFTDEKPPTCDKWPTDDLTKLGLDDLDQFGCFDTCLDPFVKEVRTEHAITSFFFCPDKTIITCPLNALHGNIRRQQTSAAWFPFTSYTVSKEPYAAFANGLPAADCAVEWSFLMLLWGYYFYTYSFIFVCLRTVFWSWHTFHFPFFGFFRKCLKMDENFIQCEAVHSASQASCSNERADCLCTLAGCEEVCMCVSVCACVVGWSCGCEETSGCGGYCEVKPVYCQVSQSSAAQRLESSRQKHSSGRLNDCCGLDRQEHRGGVPPQRQC